MLQKQREVKPTTKPLVPLANDPELKALVDKAKADKFLSAEELNLTGDQYDALIATLLLMEADGIQHIDLGETEGVVLDEGKHHFFNMLEWNATIDRGTVCCIGGTAEFLAGYLIFGPIETPIAVDKLFYPIDDINIGDWNSITPKRAASVLRKYLETGKTKW
jgi:hypothetical protein